MSKITTSWIVPSIALVIAAIILSYGIINSRTQIAKVTVKGLSERQVTADKAWWSVNSQIGGNSVGEIQNKTENTIREIKSFLEKYEINSDEYKVESMSVNANNYREAVNAYNANVRVSVNTDHINKIDKAKENLGGLLAKGILISDDRYSSGPKYFYTKFTDIKPELLAEATQEAKKAADEFAKNSGSKVGKILKANQGIVRILPANRTNEDAQYHKEKIIRIVTTVDYMLD